MLLACRFSLLAKERQIHSSAAVLVFAQFLTLHIVCAKVGASRYSDGALVF